VLAINSEFSAELGTMHDEFVKFDRVAKTYDGESYAVRDLDLAVRRTEFLTILGPSGSGKTTCLMMLAGFERPTEGTVWLDGQRITNQPAYKRDIGVVFQSYALFPHLTVEENVAFPLSVRKIDSVTARKRVRRMLDIVRLGGFGSRRPASLSGGQQQRVALARALVFQPKLLLMDEPLGALDKNLREQMQYEIKHLQQELQVTAVYVTHDQAEAITMSDRIAVLRDGTLQQLATPAEMYDHPQTAFIAQFIGESNSMEGVVTSTDGTWCDVKLDGGETARAVAVSVRRVGDRAKICIRPERVQINPADTGDMNRFSGKVAEATFCGDHVRVRVVLPGSQEFVFKVPNASEAQQPVSTFAPGQDVRLGCRPEHSRAFESDAA
jgi:putative spermidine/putrescine transport system ATP-binding protein